MKDNIDRYLSGKENIRPGIQKMYSGTFFVAENGKKHLFTEKVPEARQERGTV